MKDLTVEETVSPVLEPASLTELLATPSAEADDEIHPYHQPVQLPMHLPTHLYAGMLVIWHLRPLLQKRFPLHRGTARDYVRFLAWCATDGRRQFPLLRCIDRWNEELSRPVEMPLLRGDRWQGGFSVAMFYYGVARSRYTFGAILGDVGWRHRVARSYWRGERHKRFEPPPAPWQRRFLQEKFATASNFVDALRLPGDGKATTEELLKIFGAEDLWHPDPGATLPLGETHAVPLPSSLRFSPLRIPLLFLRHLIPWMDPLLKRPSEFQLSSVLRHIHFPPRKKTQPAYPFGVNLYGYAKGEIGIGEDVRWIAAALEANDIPFGIVNVQPGRNVSQQDHSVLHWLIDKPVYAINIYCVTGIEHGRLACESEPDFFYGRYHIGMWPWELPQWPASCHYSYGLVDEIWGISSHTAQAYRSSCPHPVITMGLPVVLPEAGTETRQDFGLPPKAFLFYFSYDINSKTVRKNPEGLIKAFQMAFPNRQDDSVGLVLKVSHADTPCAEYARLRTITAADSRIHWIDTTLRRPQVIALYRSCDCFVSLHRAEGFGRCIAEALLLGKQVITTGFSGNMDFCHEPRVALVRHRMRVVHPREYFWADGQVWADPDLDHAAELMREIRAEPRAVGNPLLQFSPGIVGALYADRLRTIWRNGADTTN
jgi:hypothetical protein